jgi:hypothetical protein
LTSPNPLSTLHFIDGSLALASLNLAVWTSCPDLTATLTTTAFGRKPLVRIKKTALRGKKWVNGGATFRSRPSLSRIFEVFGGLKTCHVFGYDSTA